MQTNIVRFTNYGTSQKNCELTCSTGIVGISQSAVSINDVVYMCYLYEDRFYVFGRALVSLLIPPCKWPDKNEFVAYCQSERGIELCSPIDVEELSIRSICEISWHLKNDKSVEDLTTINRMNEVFSEYLLEEGTKPCLTGKQFENSTNTEKKRYASRKDTVWKKIASLLYDGLTQKH